MGVVPAPSTRTLFRTLPPSQTQCKTPSKNPSLGFLEPSRKQCLENSSWQACCRTTPLGVRPIARPPALEHFGDLRRLESRELSSQRFNFQFIQSPLKKRPENWCRAKVVEKRQKYFWHFWPCLLSLSLSLLLFFLTSSFSGIGLDGTHFLQGKVMTGLGQMGHNLLENALGQGSGRAQLQHPGEILVLLFQGFFSSKKKQKSKTKQPQQKK